MHLRILSSLFKRPLLRRSSLIGPTVSVSCDLNFPICPKWSPGPRLRWFSGPPPGESDESLSRDQLYRLRKKAKEAEVKKAWEELKGELEKSLKELEETTEICRRNVILFTKKH